MNSNRNISRIPMLVSVRSNQEAILAIKSGADLIDAKEPKSGALGALPVKHVREIICALKNAKFDGVVTATYGDNVKKKINFNTKNFISYFSLGLDAIKIGFDGRGLSTTQKEFKKLSMIYQEIVDKQKKNT